MGLPNQYEPMIMGFEASGALLTARAVRSFVQQREYEEIRLIEVKGQDGLKKLFQFSEKKPGHFAVKCSETKPTAKPSKSKGFCSIFAIGNVETNEWYFYSGATWLSHGEG